MTQDLDLDDLLNQLDGLVLYEDAARIVGEFKEAAPLGALPGSGEEVWFGRSYGISSGGAGEGFAFLRLRAGRKNLVPGVEESAHLSATGFGTSLDPDGLEERTDARRVLDALMGGRPPPADSHAVRYIKEAEPRQGYAPLVKTDGKSTAIAAKTVVYLRRKGNRIFYIERWSKGAAGRYAELWKLP